MKVVTVYVKADRLANFWWQFLFCFHILSRILSVEKGFFFDIRCNDYNNYIECHYCFVCHYDRIVLHVIFIPVAIVVFSRIIVFLAICEVLLMKMATRTMLLTSLPEMWTTITTRNQTQNLPNNNNPKYATFLLIFLFLYTSNLFFLPPLFLCKASSIFLQSLSPHFCSEHTPNKYRGRTMAMLVVLVMTEDVMVLVGVSVVLIGNCNLLLFSPLLDLLLVQLCQKVRIEWVNKVCRFTESSSSLRTVLLFDMKVTFTKMYP